MQNNGALLFSKVGYFKHAGLLSRFIKRVIGFIRLFNTERRDNEFIVGDVLEACRNVLILSIALYVFFQYTVAIIAHRNGIGRTLTAYKFAIVKVFSAFILISSISLSVSSEENTNP